MPQNLQTSTRIYILEFYYYLHFLWVNTVLCSICLNPLHHVCVFECMCVCVWCIQIGCRKYTHIYADYYIAEVRDKSCGVFNCAYVYQKNTFVYSRFGCDGNFARFRFFRFILASSVSSKEHACSRWKLNTRVSSLCSRRWTVMMTNERAHVWDATFVLSCILHICSWCACECGLIILVEKTVHVSWQHNAKKNTHTRAQRALTHERRARNICIFSVQKTNIGCISGGCIICCGEDKVRRRDRS